jgi:hypothetical protein
VARKRFTFLLFAAGIVASAQQNGRFAALKSQAFDYFDRGQYDKVAGKLEEIWEQDHSDLKVGEYLAMGYLYGEKDLAKTQPIMKEVLAKGGQATFLVQHSHEKLGLLNGDTLNNYCSGRMSVVPGKVSFVADDGMHSATFSGAALKTLRLQGSGPGRFEIKAEGKNYTFRVKSETHAEAAFLQELVQQNLK